MIGFFHVVSLSGEVNVSETKVAQTGVRSIPRATLSQHLRSAVFSAVFSPVALIIMGFAVADTQAATAQGQPLSSSEGTVGIVITTLLLALVAANSDESSAGLAVTTVSAVIVGAGQLTGALRAPLWMGIAMSEADSLTSMRWSLYPICVVFICLGATVATIATRRWTVHATLRELEQASAESSQGGSSRVRPFNGQFHNARNRTWVAVFSCVALILGCIMMMVAAPEESLRVASQGLEGLMAENTFRPVPALICALCFGLVAWISQWSTSGPIVASSVLVVIPFSFLIPLWSSLTGAVVTPHSPATTQISLAAPVLSALGLLLPALVMGPLLTRRHVRAQVLRATGHRHGFVDEM